ncbi:MAG: LON peptidase substrate-binding domain-containing protein [Pseudomonadota bacterium]
MRDPFQLEFDDLPVEIPVFPLADVLLLPRGQLPLNIFEPKFLAMVDDAFANQRLIGMIQRLQRDGDSPGALYGTGCVGRISYFEETQEGRYLLNLTGLCRFDINKEVSRPVPYRTVCPDWHPYQHDLQPQDCQLDMKNFLKTLEQYFKKMDMTCEKWDQLQDIDQEKLVATLAMVCPFATQEKQALLEAETLHKRAEILVTLMEMAIRERQTSCNH